LVALQELLALLKRRKFVPDKVFVYLAKPRLWRLMKRFEAFQIFHDEKFDVPGLKSYSVAASVMIE